jgi:hypothetical protein
MDYRAFKRKMGQQDPSYKYMSDSDMTAKYDEYLQAQQGSQKETDERKENTSTLPQAFSASSGVSEVVVADIDMPFGSMVKFMVKLSLASIPAFIILVVIFSVIFAIFGGVLAGISQVLAGISQGY